MSLDQFEALRHLLWQAGASLEAAECHGRICGAVCAHAGEVWIEDGVGGAGAGDAQTGCRMELRHFQEETQFALSAPELEFTPGCRRMVASGRAREALAQRCQGFLFDVGLGGHEALAKLSADANEVLRDLTEIARAGLETGSPTSEQDENAYAELVEYLRVGVQLLFEELNPQGTHSQASALH